MKKKAILWDFDGTLADTSEVIISSWQHTFKTFTGKEGDLDYIKSTFGEILYDSMVRTFPDCNTDEVIEEYRSHQRGIFKEKVSILDDTKELLRKAHEAGIKLAVVTSRMRPTTESGLSTFGVRDLFDEVIVVEDCKNHKPHPEPAMIALERMGVCPEDAIFVGDSKFDVLCAKNAGIESVIALWYMDEDGKDAFQGQERPDYFISEPLELLDLL